MPCHGREMGRPEAGPGHDGRHVAFNEFLQAEYVRCELPKERYEPVQMPGPLHVEAHHPHHDSIALFSFIACGESLPHAVGEGIEPGCDRRSTHWGLYSALWKSRSGVFEAERNAEPAGDGDAVLHRQHPRILADRDLGRGEDRPGRLEEELGEFAHGAVLCHVHGL